MEDYFLVDIFWRTAFPGPLAGGPVTRPAPSQRRNYKKIDLKFGEIGMGYPESGLF
jgi:hypothetical protein